MKTLITFTVAMIMLFFAGVKANSGEEYNKAVLGHVVQSKVNGTTVDVNKLMEQELQRVGHLYAIQMISIFQKYLPTILDGALADMRLKADKEYKCALLKGSKIEDDCK